LCAADRERLHRAHVDIENGRERCPVRDIEEGKRAYGQVQVDRVEALPETPGALAALGLLLFGVTLLLNAAARLLVRVATGGAKRVAA